MPNNAYINDSFKNPSKFQREIATKVGITNLRFRLNELDTLSANIYSLPFVISLYAVYRDCVSQLYGQRVPPFAFHRISDGQSFGCDFLSSRFVMDCMQSEVQWHMFSTPHCQLRSNIVSFEIPGEGGICSLGNKTPETGQSQPPQNPLESISNFDPSLSPSDIAQQMMQRWIEEENGSSGITLLDDDLALDQIIFIIRKVISQVFNVQCPGIETGFLSFNSLNSGAALKGMTVVDWFISVLELATQLNLCDAAFFQLAIISYETYNDVIELTSLNQWMETEIMKEDQEIMKRLIDRFSSACQVKEGMAIVEQQKSTIGNDEKYPNSTFPKNADASRFMESIRNDSKQAVLDEMQRPILTENGLSMPEVMSEIEECVTVHSFFSELEVVKILDFFKSTILSHRSLIAFTICNEQEECRSEIDLFIRDVPEIALLPLSFGHTPSQREYRNMLETMLNNYQLNVNTLYEEVYNQPVQSIIQEQRKLNSLRLALEDAKNKFDTQNALAPNGLMFAERALNSYVASIFQEAPTRLISNATQKVIFHNDRLKDRSEKNESSDHLQNTEETNIDFANLTERLGVLETNTTQLKRYLRLRKT